MAEKDPRNSMRRVPLPEAGDGVYLHLRNSGVRVLFGLHGDNYFQIVELGLTLMDMKLIEQMLDLCGMKNGEKHKIDIDDLDDFPLEVLQTKLLDAFSLAGNGRLYQEQIEHLKQLARDEANKELADKNPPAPVATSETSSEEPTGQD